MPTRHNQVRRRAPIIVTLIALALPVGCTFPDPFVDGDHRPSSDACDYDWADICDSDYTNCMDYCAYGTPGYGSCSENCQEEHCWCLASVDCETYENCEEWYGGDADTDADTDADADADTDADADADHLCPEPIDCTTVNMCSCGPYDLCGWADNGTCEEEVCQPLVDKMFIDDADCLGDCPEDQVEGCEASFVACYTACDSDSPGYEDCVDACQDIYCACLAELGCDPTDYDCPEG